MISQGSLGNLVYISSTPPRCVQAYSGRQGDGGADLLVVVLRVQVEVPVKLRRLDEPQILLQPA